jgi:hypothetical protein
MNMHDYATPFEAQCLEAFERHGSFASAGDELEVHRSTVQRAIERVKVKAAAAGHAPGHFENGTAPGFIMGKVTVQRGPQGEIERTWERQSPDKDAFQDALIAAAAAMAEELPRQKPLVGPLMTSAKLLNLYTYTDYHLGMLAWQPEGGAHWDLKIAEDMLLRSFLGMLTLAPEARKCVINIQGDFLHSDGLLPVTPAHKHVLDQDGRFSKIVAAAIRVLRKLCNAALEKHAEVHVVIAEGNHDEASSVWLRHMFAALYDEEPRLTVNDSELPYYVYRHGKCMLAFHHGHKMKNEQMPMLFAAQFPRMWGITDYRYCNTGHRHHIDEKEYSGMLVTQHPTLSARDAYAARGGWISERAAVSSTFHEEMGRIFNNYIRPEMFELDEAA